MILGWLSFRNEFRSRVWHLLRCFVFRTGVSAKREWLLTKRKGQWEREKWEAKISSRESLWVRGSSRVKFLLYSHARIEGHSLRRVDQTRMRHSLQTINFQCGTKFFSVNMILEWNSVATREFHLEWKTVWLVRAGNVVSIIVLVPRGQRSCWTTSLMKTDTVPFPEVSVLQRVERIFLLMTYNTHVEVQCSAVLKISLIADVGNG